MNLLVIGGGNMGHTYAMSIKTAMEAVNVSILEAYPPKVAELKKEDIFDIYTDPKEIVSKSDIIMLAVKPQSTEELFEAIKNEVHSNQIVISIMAGVTMTTMSDSLGLAKVVRAMPNLPAQVGKGMTGFCTASTLSDSEKDLVKQILDSTGKSIVLDSENDIDACTGISGSGPAYVFYFMKAMMESAEKLGFSKEEAKIMVSQTFDGAVTLFNKNELTTEEWINRVASKGGTTRAALDSFESNEVLERIIDGAEAAYNRAVELGKNF